jgi:hypothetical protein
METAAAATTVHAYTFNDPIKSPLLDPEVAARYSNMRKTGHTYTLSLSLSHQKTVKTTQKQQQQENTLVSNVSDILFFS